MCSILYIYVVCLFIYYMFYVVCIDKYVRGVYTLLGLKCFEILDCTSILICVSFYEILKRALGVRLYILECTVLCSLTYRVVI